MKESREIVSFCSSSSSPSLRLKKNEKVRVSFSFLPLSYKSAAVFFSSFFTSSASLASYAAAALYLSTLSGPSSPSNTARTVENSGNRRAPSAAPHL